jgi:1,4-alpha-glucan branching enzyme
MPDHSSFHLIMYAPIVAERAPFGFQMSATCFTRGLTGEPTARAFAGREIMPHLAPFASGALEVSESCHRELVLFRIDASNVSTAKLVGDFACWEDLPLDLGQDDGGGWQNVVPLQPGRYAHRLWTASGGTIPTASSVRSIHSAVTTQ